MVPAAMHDETSDKNAEAPAKKSPDEALKNPSRPAKGGGRDKEARLAAALRENLRRRKAGARKDNRLKDTD